MKQRLKSFPLKNAVYPHDDGKHGSDGLLTIKAMTIKGV